MAADSRKTSSEMFISRRPKKNRNRVNGTANTDVIITGDAPDTSPVVIKPKMSPFPSPVRTVRKVPVLYYLTRNGNIEQPHLMDVPLSSPHGLYLRDVMNTMNYHRGKGMANMYSWSFKRSYKNGFVWHDLSEDDLIEPTNGYDYVIKGSELLQTHPSQIPARTGDDCSSTPNAAAAIIRRRNQSWSSFDNPQEYMVVKCESSRELAAKFAASTQTEEQRRRLSFERDMKEHVTMTVEREEEMPTPPPSNSSSEGVIGPRDVDRTVNTRENDLTVKDQHDASGRMKASKVLKQLIACGALSRLKMQAG